MHIRNIVYIIVTVITLIIAYITSSSMYLRPVVRCTCAITARDDNRLNIFERKVLRKSHGPIYHPDIQV